MNIRRHFCEPWPNNTVYRWRRRTALGRNLFERFWREHLTGGMLIDEEYTDLLWHSQVNLAFITKLNEDDVAHKTFEIATCGQFLLACRSEEHMALFEEDSEAAFFTTLAECADKAHFYLDRPEPRKSFGERTRQRG